MKRLLARFNRLLRNKNILLVMAVFLVIFNIVDASITYWAVDIMHVAHEINPIMDFLLSTSPTLFFLVKILFSLFASIYFYIKRKEASSRYGLFGAFLIYFVVVILVTTQGIMALGY